MLSAFLKAARVAVAEYNFFLHQRTQMFKNALQRVVLHYRLFFKIVQCIILVGSACIALHCSTLLYMQTLVLHFVNNGLLPVKQTKREKLTYYSKQDCKKAVISKTENS